MSYHYENKLPKVVGFILLSPELCHGILKMESSENQLPAARNKDGNLYVGTVMKHTQDAVLLDGFVIVGKVVVYQVRSILLLEPGLYMPLINLSYSYPQPQ